MEQETLSKLTQCMWCGSKEIDFLHHEFILPVCPKCLEQLRAEK